MPHVTTVPDAPGAHALGVSDNNTEKNREHYNVRLGEVTPGDLVAKVRNVDAFLTDAAKTDTSWVAIYQRNLRSRLAGARVLELGAGDGLNALVMAALGAHVVCIDLSERTPALVQPAARALGLEDKVEAIAGDFGVLEFAPRSFDFIIGKAFLHHLTHPVEAQYLRKVSALLRADGEARFAEPAINSPWLDALRWMVAVKGRPSRLNARAFGIYKNSDPHPDREHSSEHYRRVALQYFERVEIVPVGGLERLHRLLPDGRGSRSFRRFAYRAERLLPHGIQMKIARGQTLLLSRPRSDSDMDRSSPEGPNAA